MECMCTRGKYDSLVYDLYRAIKVLDQPMKMLEGVFENRIRCNVSIDDMSGRGTTDDILK